RTRAWQFAFGGLVAIVIDRIKIANSLRFIFGYIGLALIATVGFVLDAGQLFPGPWALWPLLGFALVLLAAPQEPEETPQKWSVPHILSNRAFGWVGDHAYGLSLALAVTHFLPGTAGSRSSGCSWRCRYFCYRSCTGRGDAPIY